MNTIHDTLIALWNQYTPELDWDEADYVGTEEDGVYFGAVEDPDAPREEPGWWAVADVDCNSASFAENLCTDGPYADKDEALRVARAAATGWCDENGVVMP
jgi:hypothetical protein